MQCPPPACRSTPAGAPSPGFLALSLPRVISRDRRLTAPEILPRAVTTFPPPRPIELLVQTLIISTVLAFSTGHPKFILASSSPLPEPASRAWLLPPHVPPQTASWPHSAYKRKPSFLALLVCLTALPSPFPTSPHHAAWTSLAPADTGPSHNAFSQALGRWPAPGSSSETLTHEPSPFHPV